MKTYLRSVFLSFFLLIGAAVQGQPDLSIVLSNEFGPGFRGLVGYDLGSFTTRYAMSNELNWNSTLPVRDIENQLPPWGHKIMRFVLEIVNTGRDKWSAGNAWVHPEHYKWLDFYGPCITDLIGVVISAPDGNVVRERLPELALLWNVNPAVPNIPNSYSYYNVSIDGGYGASSGWDGMEYLTDSLIDISLLTNGFYRLQIVIDPLNRYGIFNASKNPVVWISLNEAEVLPSNGPVEPPRPATPTRKPLPGVGGLTNAPGPPRPPTK